MDIEIGKFEPMPPQMGPPLPKSWGIYWPWFTPEEEPPPPEPGKANLFGVIVSADTKNVLAGVTVTLNGTSTQTDAFGYYAFTDLVPGSYDIVFEKGDYEEYAYSLLLEEGQNKLNVELTPTEPEVPPEPGKAKLSGVVISSESKNVLSGVTVTLDVATKQTDANGNYSFTDFDPGSYEIRFEKEGYEELAYSVTLAEGENQLNMEMVPTEPEEPPPEEEGISFYVQLANIPSEAADANQWCVMYDGRHHGIIDAQQGIWTEIGQPILVENVKESGGMRVILSGGPWREWTYDIEGTFQDGQTFTIDLSAEEPPPPPEGEGPKPQPPLSAKVGNWRNAEMAWFFFDTGAFDEHGIQTFGGEVYMDPLVDKYKIAGVYLEIKATWEYFGTFKTYTNKGVGYPEVWLGRGPTNGGWYKVNWQDYLPSMFGPGVGSGDNLWKVQVTGKVAIYDSDIWVSPPTEKQLLVGAWKSAGTFVSPKGKPKTYTYGDFIAGIQAATNRHENDRWNQLAYWYYTETHVLSSAEYYAIHDAWKEKKEQLGY